MPSQKLADAKEMILNALMRASVDEKVLPLTATLVGDASAYVVKPLIVTDSTARLP